MKSIVKCCLALVLGFAAVGYSKNVGHKKVQLWKDGPYWAETNIGAEKPWESGYYFWWGDTIGYKRVNNSWVASDGSSLDFSFVPKRTPTIGKDESTLRKEGWIAADNALVPEHDAAHLHWGAKWRMPTLQELSDLCNKCDWTWMATNNVNGYVIRGRGDYAAVSIFLPSAGYSYGTSLRSVDSCGACWASGHASCKGYYGSWRLDFSSDSHNTGGLSRYLGLSIRPVQGNTEKLQGKTQ